MIYCCLLFVLNLVNVSIDSCNSCDVYDIANRTLEVGKVDSLVQAHLDRANNLGILVDSLQKLLAALVAAHIREYESVDIKPLKTCEWVLVVA